MSNMRLLIFSFSLILPGSVFGQSSFIQKKNKNIGIFNITQIGYNRGIGNATFRSDVVVRNRGSVNRLRTTFGYFITPSISLGIGFGLDGYHNPGYNTAPLMVDFRYYRSPANNSLFLTANTGYSLKMGSDFTSGFAESVNLGYRFILGSKTHILFSAGLDLHQINDARILVFSPPSFERIQNNIWLKSISFNGGFLF